MESEYKTLRELNVKPGDVVEHEKSKACYNVFFKDGEIWVGSLPLRESRQMYRIISRASETPKLWRDMTPEEKGALLLAHHEGKVIELFGLEWTKTPFNVFSCWNAYRVRPEPKRETVTFVGHVFEGKWCGMAASDGRGHRITFDLIDGNPDCASIKMEEME
jgi:hypothetical protein